MNGRVILEYGKIPCLIVESVTEAEDLNLELWEKTLFLMKKLVIGDDNQAIQKFKISSAEDDHPEQNSEKFKNLQGDVHNNNDDEEEIEIY